MFAQFSTPKGPFSLLELAEASGASLYKKEGSSLMVYGLASLTKATSRDISMLHRKLYLGEFKHSGAGACITSAEYVEHAPESMHLLIHPNPYKAYALIAQAFYPAETRIEFRAPSAFIAPDAIIGRNSCIEHGAYIGSKARIGERCKIGVNTFIGDNVVIGDNCCIENNVSISHAVLGERVLIYPGARIGQDGFGFASDAEGHYKIPHMGGVIIGNDVAIGANTCIDRGSLDNTVIEDWCRLDNLIQIGHNVKIGKGSVIVAQAGIAGSTELGEYVTLAGQVGVIGHLTIGSGATVVAGSRVYNDIKPGSRMGGCPAVPLEIWQKQIRHLKKIAKPKAPPKD